MRHAGRRRGVRSGLLCVGLAGIQFALGNDFAVDDKAVGLARRIGKCAVAGLDLKNVFAGGGNTQLAGPARAVIVGLNLVYGDRVAPVGLDLGVGAHGDGTSGTFGACEVFGL